MNSLVNGESLENGLAFINKKRAEKKRKMMIKKVIIFSIAIFMCLTASVNLTKVFAHAGEAKIEKQLATYQKVTVVVEKGDTLWSLQQKLTPNDDISQILFLAEKNAGHKLTNIHPGDEVVLLKK